MEFRVWMIESSSEYIKGSRILWNHELLLPAWIDAGIGLEILLKSFLAEVDGPVGGIGEQYKFDAKKRKTNGHDLLALFDAIDPAVINQLRFGPYRDYFLENLRTPFLDRRYPYEREAASGITSVITDIAEEMLDKVIRAYKALGCTDPWIQAYPNPCKLVYNPDDEIGLPESSPLSESLKRASHAMYSTSRWSFFGVALRLAQASSATTMS